MTSPEQRPPSRLADTLLRLLLRQADYEGVSGDLREEYVEHLRAGGSRLTGWWRYWREAFTALQLTYQSERAASRSWTKHFALSWRALVRAPSFAVPAALTMALGIGAATAVFSLVYAILLRPFPYPEADRLVRVFTVAESEEGAERNCSLLDIEEYNRRSRLVQNFGGYTVFDSQIEGDGQAEAIVVAQLNQEAMRAVGVQPLTGRLFTAEEDRKGGPVNKALLSYGLWQSRYGGGRDIVGRLIRTPVGEFEVVGVMPAGYGYPDRADLWLTMESWYALGIDTYRNKQRDQRWYATVARLAPGISLAQAQDEMTGIAHQLAAEFPQTNSDVGVRLVPLRDAEVGEVRPYLMLLAGGVALVLLICIFNVTNLLLARVITQRKQYVVQAALGAGRFELAKGFLAESLLLTLAGGAGGAAIAWVAVRAFQALLPDSLPRWMSITVDPYVLAFCFGATVLCGLALGLAPAFVGSRVNLNNALKDSGRGSSGGTRGRSALVIAEVAASLLLLLGAGLLMKTFLQMQRADHGFDAENLIIAYVRNNSFSTAPRAERAGLLAGYHERMIERLEAIPGVESAAVTNSLPYGGGDLRHGRLRIQGRAEEETQFLLPTAGADVSWDYFETIGIPLTAGRIFQRTDASDQAPVVIINEVGAKALFGDRNPIGEMVQWGDTVGPANPYCRIVGVVGDVKHHGAERDAIELYYPYTQWPVGGGYYVLRTRLDQSAAAQAIRAAVESTDPNAAIVSIRSMTERIDEALWQRRLWGVLFTVFAALALLLAGVGLYGLLSYGVSERSRDIGIRLALGADPAGVRAMVVRRGMILVLTGLALGLVLSLGALRMIAHLLVDVAAFDWAIYGSVAAALIAAGLAASLWPAIRASRLDPARTLRSE